MARRRRCGSWQDGKLTVRVAEDGGEAVAQRVAVALRLGSGEAALRRLGARTARWRFLLRAEDARRRGVRRKEKAPPLPLL